MPIPVFANLNRDPNVALPDISTQLDAVRAYQFEVQFNQLPTDVGGDHKDLTIAAKQVTALGMSVEDIEVNRVNDRVWYPGRPTQEEVTITFDNLYVKKAASTLWRWFTTIYDPITGEMTPGSAPGGGGEANVGKIQKMSIIQLDNTSQPHATVDLFAVFPKSWKTSEFNYSTNEFHTLEVVFRYDFMQAANY